MLLYDKPNLHNVNESNKNTICYRFQKGYCKLKLLSQYWWILIPNIKTNQHKQQYLTDNHYQ